MSNAIEKQEFQIGDTIYCIDEDYKEFEDTIKNVFLEVDNTICYTGYDGWDFWKKDIGVTVFKTNKDRINFLTY